MRADVFADCFDEKYLRRRLHARGRVYVFLRAGTCVRACVRASASTRASACLRELVSVVFACACATSVCMSAYVGTYVCFKHKNAQSMCG